MSTVQLCLILMMCGSLLHTVLGQLTTDDFYKDPSADVVLNETDDHYSTLPNFPLTISNIRLLPTSASTNTIKATKGAFYFDTSNDLFVFTLRPGFLNTLLAGRLIVRYSTNSTLLNRARNDIKACSDNAPTHLILMDNIEIGRSNSEQKSTFQTVLATNGRYTYLIVQFVSVERAAVNDRAYLHNLGIPNVDLPYQHDISAAPTNTNVGTPGKYVIDLNEEIYNRNHHCKQKMLLMTCEVYRLAGKTLPSVCNN